MKKNIKCFGKLIDDYIFQGLQLGIHTEDDDFKKIALTNIMLKVMNASSSETATQQSRRVMSWLI